MTGRAASQEGARTFASFRDIHRGAPIAVCGCGESLNRLTRPEQFVTIGMNDVGRLFQPDYLVVVDPRTQFHGDRFRYVETSGADYIFTQRTDLDLHRCNIVKFCLGEKEGIDFSDPNVLHYSVITPYVAVCLAAHMGASQIGLIGVDFTENHFFARTGPHPWSPFVETIDRQFARLRSALLARGVELLNLSPTSRLAALPKVALESLVIPPSTCAPSRMACARARLEWRAAWRTVESEIDRLYAAMISVYADHDFGEQLHDVFGRKVDPLLRTFGNILDARLEALGNQSAAALRCGLAAELRATAREYAAFVQREPLIAELDANPFVALNLGSTLHEALARLSMAMRETTTAA